MLIISPGAINRILLRRWDRRADIRVTPMVGTNDGPTRGRTGVQRIVLGSPARRLGWGVPWYFRDVDESRARLEGLLPSSRRGSAPGSGAAVLGAPGADDGMAAGILGPVQGRISAGAHLQHVCQNSRSHANTEREPQARA